MILSSPIGGQVEKPPKSLPDAPPSAICGKRHECAAGPLLRLHREPALFVMGSRGYRVRVASEPIFIDGCECLGLCSEKRAEIQISPAMPLADRLFVLMHELTHAQILSTGYPADAESICDLFGTIAAVTFRTLCDVGGEAALIALAPGETLAVKGGRHAAE